MTKKPFNPYAFPANDFGDRGMSLRDWFAGQALVGLLASWSVADEQEFKGLPDYYRVRGFASAAYLVADAMLAERMEPPHDAELTKERDNG